MAKSLAKLSIADLNAEIRRRQRSTGTLARRRDKLMAKINALNSQIQQLGGSVNGGGGKSGGKWSRPKNDMNLAEALGQVLKGKTLSVTDAAEAVQKAGYKTNSNNFRTQVNIALIKGGFKRVGRGEYTAK